jgi:nucleotide-binding universal stress UspA family protein
VTVIVVGVDGSETSKRALRWAIDEARLRHSTVRAVTAWQYAVSDSWEGMPVNIYDTMEEGAKAQLAALVEEVGGEDAKGVEQVIALGAPASALLDAAKDAELLVLGSRGLGGFKGLLVGSVSQQCVHHAVCPVVVIPHVEEPES